MSSGVFPWIGVPVALALFSMTAFAGPRNTTITATKTARVVRTETRTFAWTIQKAKPPGQVPYIIRPGDTAYATFSITANRTGPVVSETVSDVTGQVCVTNTGTGRTRGLQIKDQLEVLNGDTWVLVAGPIDIAVAAELNAGANFCFPYAIDFSPDPERQYRNVALVSIDNFAGHEGTTHAISALANVAFEDDAIEIGASALVTDTFQCPPGFVCNPLSSSQVVTDSAFIPVQISIFNQTAECGKTIEAVNTASLVPSNTSQSQTASVAIQIYSGSCNGG